MTSGHHIGQLRSGQHGKETKDAWSEGDSKSTHLVGTVSGTLRAHSSDTFRDPFKLLLNSEERSQTFQLKEMFSYIIIYIHLYTNIVKKHF